ncbi:hypothetical protein HZ326_7181 [Fusarium oxysporum f. sp. albedinis]|nr:hypothetical protein HZ326_7181 [Fusarium oxysporum f. sp. albedinis]
MYGPSASPLSDLCFHPTCKPMTLSKFKSPGGLTRPFMKRPMQPPCASRLRVLRSVDRYSLAPSAKNSAMEP